MELIINIPDEEYNRIKEWEDNITGYQTSLVLYRAVRNGIPYEETNTCEGRDIGGSNMTDKIKQAVADEFKYRASEGRTNYSMEEVIYIVGEVIDEVNFGENKVMSQNQSQIWTVPVDVDMQIRVIKCDLKYLSEKVNRLSSLLEEHNGEAESHGEHQ